MAGQMNSSAEPHPGRFDTLKLATALLVESAGIVGFYWFADQPQYLRVIGLLFATGAALLVAAQTDFGRVVLGFLRDSNTEVRKIVWPTRQETVQTTLGVVLMVLVVALFLWVLDSSLAWLVQAVTGRGGAS